MKIRRLTGKIEERSDGDIVEMLKQGSEAVKNMSQAQNG